MLHICYDNMPPEKSKLLRGLLSKDKQRKDRKILNPQAKELILNVVNFMKQEANGEFVIPAKKVQCRAAVATGFSERTVRRVVKESKSLPQIENANGEGVSVSFPPKKVPNRPKPKTGLDSLTRATVRKIIHRIYVNEKTVPTIKSIHQKLVQEIGFKGGSRSAHKVIKELGFFWKKTKSKSFVLIEKHEIRLRRIEYLRDIMRYRREGRPIIYIGDSAILSSLCNHQKPKTVGERIVLMHAGGERGFIPNALSILSSAKPTGDYHQELSEHYYTWVRDTLLPAFPSQSVVVIDNSAYQNIQTEKIPTSDSNAEQMKLWLHSKNIHFSEDMLRPELHQIIKRHASKFKKQKGVIEQLITERGHTVLKLPPDHPDLNPVDLLWADVKHFVAERNTTFQIRDVKMLCEERLNEISPEVWTMRCNHVKAIEQQYLESEGIVDHEVEKIMAKPAVNKDNNTLKTRQEENHLDDDDDDDDDQHDNINFVRHFMGGLLGLEEYKMFNG